MVATVSRVLDRSSCRRLSMSECVCFGGFEECMPARLAINVDQKPKAPLLRPNGKPTFSIVSASQPRFGGNNPVQSYPTACLYRFNGTANTGNPATPLRTLWARWSTFCCCCARRGRRTTLNPAGQVSGPRTRQRENLDENLQWF